MHCACLNGEGGPVLIGVAPDGGLVGRDVADIALRDIAAMARPLRAAEAPFSLHA